MKPLPHADDPPISILTAVIRLWSIVRPPTSGHAAVKCTLGPIDRSGRLAQTDPVALLEPVFNTIVVGIDGRQGGRDALRLAGQLPKAGGGELAAVRVFPYQHRPALAGSPAVKDERRARPTMLDRGLSAMGIGPQRTHVVGATSPARALHRMAERERADVLVVGSTHRGAVGRELVGDVALGSLHGSPCPVAVAPRGMARGDAAPLRCVGVGFDGSQESRQVDLAAALATSARARLELLCVVRTRSRAEGACVDGGWLSIARTPRSRSRARSGSLTSTLPARPWLAARSRSSSN
jgi:nucleotide-binding universal stress UspA family protein